MLSSDRSMLIARGSWQSVVDCRVGGSAIRLRDGVPQTFEIPVLFCAQKVPNVTPREQPTTKQQALGRCSHGHNIQCSASTTWFRGFLVLCHSCKGKSQSRNLLHRYHQSLQFLPALCVQREQHWRAIVFSVDLGLEE